MYEPKAIFIRQARPRYSFFGFCEPILCMKIIFGVTFLDSLHGKMKERLISTLADKDKVVKNLINIEQTISIVRKNTRYGFKV